MSQNNYFHYLLFIVPGVTFDFIICHLGLKPRNGPWCLITLPRLLSDFLNHQWGEKEKVQRQKDPESDERHASIHPHQHTFGGIWDHLLNTKSAPSGELTSA